MPIKTPNDKTEMLSRVGLTVDAINWSEYQVLTLAKLSREDKWERIKQTLTIATKPQLTAIVLQLVADNSILSQEFVNHVNQTIASKQGF